MKLCTFTLIVGFVSALAHVSKVSDESNFYDLAIKTNEVSQDSKNKTSISENPIVDNATSIQTPEDPNSCLQNETIHCDPTYPYRTINGTCNNLHHPTWGSARECYLRFLQSVYSGYVDARKSINGNTLIEARDITLKVFPSSHEPSSKVSFMFAIFGLTVGHDVSWSLPIQPGLECCSPQNRVKPFCWNIYLKPDDPFFSQFNWTCLGFRRTLECPCDTTNREQLNGVTAAFDGSLIYGNSDKKAMQLRANDGTGKLVVYESEHGDLLPTETHRTGPFCPLMKENKCFMAGDSLVNLHSTLTSIQTIYMREHNRLATKLKALNPHWDEERLYQESRKINGAQLQCIAFKEFLPILLGPILMEQFNLSVTSGSGGTKYDPNIRFGTRSEFSAAAYRLHSMVNQHVDALGKRFRNLYLNTELIREGHLHQIVQGISRTPSQEFDRWFVEDIINYLFQAKGRLFGTDLVSMDVLRGRDQGLPTYVQVVNFCSGGKINITKFTDLSPLLMENQNFRRLEKVYGNPGLQYGNDLSSVDIQRGRDHGLAPYIVMVRFCSEGRISISTFGDLAPLLMTKQRADTLKKYYAAVEDIDLWVGVQMEHHYPGAQVSPTAACIISKQFYFSKYGDRFFFEHEGEVPSFTAAQRNSLKQCSLSRLLCDNSKMLHVQKNVLLLPSITNPEVPCKEIPEIDLSHWAENPRNENSITNS